MNKIKIAQIGVGYWGPNLLRNMVANKSCEVRTVVDLSKERRHFVQHLYPSVRVSNGVEDIINDADIEAVVIATPVATHFDLAMKCLETGKHILVEKPMATTVEEVRQIGKLADKKGLIAMVGHTFLFNSAVRYVKTLIESGELGDIRYIYSQRVNLGRVRNDVDALWNLAPHDVSIIQYWLNDQEPVSVNRSGQSYVQKGIDDVVFLNISYPGNIMANIHVSWLDPHKLRRMTIVGSEKMVVYDDIAENKIIVYDKGIDRMAELGKNMDFDNPNTFYFNHRSGDVVMPKLNWEEPLKLEISHFIECIQKETKCITGTMHAEKVVKILEQSN
ncbi:MAG: Gfo/Idh/MocA family oxidoreductase [Candidatus Marinimicrobia bacterium]|jgi:predicted dehydrogenase|nr:Gfo/Idh/MocA family oxidoreductase [Candidatus Neomarinimicrobiota bacterium]